MINLDNIIGDIIFISFVNLERFKDIGITESSGHFLLKGHNFFHYSFFFSTRVQSPLPKSNPSAPGLIKFFGSSCFFILWSNVLVSFVLVCK